VNIGCAALDCVQQHLVDETHNWRVLDFVASVVLIFVLLAADIEIFEIEIVVIEAAHAGVDGFDRLDDPILQFVLLDDNRVDAEAGRELDVIDGLQVGRIGNTEE
jgi:hypothetical protein